MKTVQAFTRVSAAVLVLILLNSVMPGLLLANDLQHYYNLALKNDPQFRGSKYEHLANQESLSQAYAALLPKVYADANYTFTGQKIISSDNSVFSVGDTSYDSWGYSFNLVQPLFKYGSFVGVGQARTILKRADLELEKAKQDLTVRFVEAYMDILFAHDRLQAIKAEEDALVQHNERAKLRSAKGMAPVTDRYDSEARLAAVRAQRIESENFLNDKKQALAEICGPGDLNIKPLKNDIPMLAPMPENLESWVSAARKQNLDILIQKIRAEIAEKEVERQKSAHYPTVDFQADYIKKETGGTLFGGGSNTGTYDFIFKITVPIFEGGLIASKTREAGNMHQISIQSLEKFSRAAERKVNMNYYGVLGAISKAEAMKKSIEAQQLVVEAKQEGFRAGLFIGVAVLDSLQDLYRYRREFSQARNDYILNSFRLKQTVGTLGEEDLKQLNSWLQQ